MLAAARLRHVAGMKWGTRRYLDTNRLARALRHESPRSRRHFSVSAPMGALTESTPNWRSFLNKSAKNSGHYLQRPGASS
jgi:hypothetical protein